MLATAKIAPSLKSYPIQVKMNTNPRNARSRAFRLAFAWDEKDEARKPLNMQETDSPSLSPTVDTADQKSDAIAHFAKVAELTIDDAKAALETIAKKADQVAKQLYQKSESEDHTPPVPVIGGVVSDDIHTIVDTASPFVRQLTDLGIRVTSSKMATAAARASGPTPTSSSHASVAAALNVTTAAPFGLAAEPTAVTTSSALLTAPLIRNDAVNTNTTCLSRVAAAFYRLAACITSCRTCCNNCTCCNNNSSTEGRRYQP